MPKLFVVGDSFSHQYEKPDWPIWTTQLANQLNLDLVNYSLPGCDQEWQLQKIRELGNLDTQDIVIIVLTSRSRFWCIKEYPQYSNIIHNVDVALNTLSSLQIKAVQDFYRYIWRDDLAKSMQKSKLREISWIFKKSNVCPIILNAFANDIDDKFDNLNIAVGNLTDNLSILEFAGSKTEKINFMNSHWNHHECRFNHICKINHKILANELSKAIINNDKIDLTKISFEKNIINVDNYNNSVLAHQQFSSIKFREMCDSKLKKKFFK